MPKMPIIKLTINTKNKPFYSDGNAGDCKTFLLDLLLFGRMAGVCSGYIDCTRVVKQC